MGGGKKWFPENYCNPAARALQKELMKDWVHTELAFTYEKRWIWHTFLKDKDGNIIDPTYGQFDKNYPNWFYGKKFPNNILQSNITPWDEFMKLQKKRSKDWVYD